MGYRWHTSMRLSSRSIIFKSFFKFFMYFTFLLHYFLPNDIQDRSQRWLSYSSGKPTFKKSASSLRCYHLSHQCHRCFCKVPTRVVSYFLGRNSTLLRRSSHYLIKCPKSQLISGITNSFKQLPIAYTYIYIFLYNFNNLDSKLWCKWEPRCFFAGKI